MKERKQSSTTYPITFLLVSSTDHITAITGATPTVTISKNGGSFASPSGAVTEIGNGWYALAGNATDRNTLGTFLLHASATGADPTDDRYAIVPWDPFDDLTPPTTAQIADKVLGRTLAGGADGGRTVTDALRVSRNKVVVADTPSGTTLTVYAEDDATVAWTAVLTTDAAANPITVMDPA